MFDSLPHSSHIAPSVFLPIYHTQTSLTRHTKLLLHVYCYFIIPYTIMPQTLDIQLQNRYPSDDVYAYITGLALNNNNRVFLLRADGKTPYYPDSPPHTVHPLSADCAIRLGKQGSTTIATIPLLAGGRIWFSIGKKLEFFVNPGPALVEPSVTNPSDHNINTNWAFCEFTFNQTQIYANIRLFCPSPNALQDC